LLQDAGVAGFAGAVVAVDDGQARLAEREAFARRQRVDMRQAVEGTEADDGMAGRWVPDVARVERDGCRVTLANREEGRDVGCLQLGLATQPAQRVALPGRQVRRPFEDIGERRRLIRKIVLLRFHHSAP